jgi:hypothetical protein
MNDPKETTATKPARKGLHKVFRIYRSYSYISIFAAIAFGIFGIVDLINNELGFLNRTSAFQLMMLCAIFGLLLRHYYKTFEQR